MEAFPLGSGFFVSPKVFLTCCHVVNGTSNPHQDGDTYHLVNNLTGNNGVVHLLPSTTLGKDIHLFQNADLALFILPVPADQTAYVNLDFGLVQQGADIGVAGYPLPNLVVMNNQLRYDGLLYRVARGPVTATYNATIEGDQIKSSVAVPMIEVNFLFVPGNSGGPIFRANNGSVVGYVHGFRAQTIVQRHSQAFPSVVLPPGMSRDYVENIHAVYSVGIKMECAKNTLQSFGVSL